MILLKSKQYMLIGLTAVALSLSACGGDSAKNGAKTKAPDTEEPAPSVTDKDTDGDGVLDSKDNCPTVPNVDQADEDKDLIGDFCDNDIDGDGINNAADECPFDDDTTHKEADCLAPDADFDKDGVKNSVDNCIFIKNGINEDNQADSFNKAAQNNTPDGIGDACQDSDNDGKLDSVDNCPTTYNPDQTDTDGDTVLDPKSASRFDPSKGGDACDDDDDDDGIRDFYKKGEKTPDGTVVLEENTIALDNCRLVSNPIQGTTYAGNEPGFNGEACSTDADGDGLADNADSCKFTKNYFPQKPEAERNPASYCTDSDGDGVNDNIDNCKFVANPDQLNTDAKDGDTTGDACESIALGGDGDTDNDGFPDVGADGKPFDECPTTKSATNEKRFCSTDFDEDGVPNTRDNCEMAPNPTQADLDKDGKGDACDDDTDGDGFPDADPDGDGPLQADNCPLIANPDQSTKPCDLAANIGNLQCDSYTVATVEPIVKGALCQILGALNNPLGLCGVNNATAAADGSDQSFATINNAVVLPDSLAGNLLTGEVGVRVKLPAERKEGSLAAMEIEIPGGTLDLTLFRNIKLVTKRNGVEVDRRETVGEFATNPGDAFSLDILGFSPIGSSKRALLGFVSTGDFDTIELTVTAGLSVDLLEQLRVYDTCSAASVKPGTTTGSTTPPSTNPLAGTPLEGLGDVGSMIPGLGGGAFPPELPGAGSGEDPLAIFTDPEGPFAPLVALFSDPAGAFTTFAEMFTGFFSNPGAAFSGLTEMFSPAS